MSETNAWRDLMRFLDSLSSLEMGENLVCQQPEQVLVPVFLINIFSEIPTQ